MEMVKPRVGAAWGPPPTVNKSEPFLDAKEVAGINDRAGKPGKKGC
jgi:hypothetical protein